MKAEEDEKEKYVYHLTHFSFKGGINEVILQA